MVAGRSIMNFRQDREQQWRFRVRPANPADGQAWAMLRRALGFEDAGAIRCFRKGL
jgi:hypothetical protein